MSFTKKILPLAMAAALPMMAAPNAAFAGADPFIGEITYVGFNFPPRDWAQCDGQILQIASYTALYSLLGTRYGGDGRSSFGLPDMRGRVPVHYGQGPGLSGYALGQRGGYERITLDVLHLPAHKHGATLGNAQVSNVVATSTMMVANATGTSATATAGMALANSSSPVTKIYASATPDTLLADTTIDTNITSMDIAADVVVTNTGGGQPFPNVQPFLALNCIIALDGIYPQRN